MHRTVVDLPEPEGPIITSFGTGGSDDNQLLAFFYFQIYIFQYLEISEILTYIFQSDHFAPPFYVPGRNF